MNAAKPDLSGRLEELRARIERAEARSGRASGSVTLVAVVKTVPVESIRAVVALGVSDIGENRVQEAEAHAAAIEDAGVRWHLIGHLQRNKAGRAVERFARIHSVDDVGLATALSRRAVSLGRTLRVLIEVNVSGEATKFGVGPEGVTALIEQVSALPGLALDGLMTIGAPVAQPEDARAGFAELKRVRDRAASGLGIALPQLSMGMSDDFEVAVEEGATLVRIGRALFGSRS